MTGVCASMKTWPYFPKPLAKWILSGEQSKRKAGEELLSQNYHLQRISESVHSSFKQLMI